ncbi:HET-domain-containing protein [Thozetella sp. PMI_491]|nr:HET-domain-containing protein [Thozetella sp. PMI_491]
MTPSHLTSKAQWFTLYHDTGENAPAEVASLGESTWSRNTVSLAKRWIANCTSYHCGCKPSNTGGPWCPTRLLHFDLTPSSGTDQFRLVETKNMGFTGQYTTLSHCWGTGSHFTLNKSTYSLLTQGYPFSSLPRLFQDSITVSRDLGIGYIWIDSLCIFQDTDDKSDWEREASLMQLVYSHSFCNISAAQCKGSLETMFYPRDCAILPPPVINIQLSDKIQDQITYEDERRDRGHNRPDITSEGTSNLPQPITTPFRLAADIWSDEVSNAVLNTRAWVVQERLLSPRILHFGRNEVIWECCHTCASETYPDGFPEVTASGEHEYKSSVPAADSATDVGSIAAHVRWERIVETYTGCNLTFGGDKLIALSGIASRIGSSLMAQDKYIAGMWRRDLEGQLLWWVNNPVAAPTQYRAPSWSWAAVDGSVSVHFERRNLLIQVEAVHIEHCTTNVTGAISDGWLRLRGILKRVCAIQNSEGGWDISMDDLTIKEDKTDAIMVRTMVLFDVKDDDIKWENGKCCLYCMAAVDDRRLSMQLLLFQVINVEAGLFRRVGIALVGDGAFRKKARAENKTDNSLPCVQFRGGMHLICIV